MTTPSPEDIDFMRERYLELALAQPQHGGLVERILATAEGRAQPAPLVVAPAMLRPRWGNAWRWAQAACLLAALAIIGWLMLNTMRPHTPGNPHVNTPIAPPDDTPSPLPPVSDDEPRRDDIDDEIDAYLALADADKDGKVSWDEARVACLKAINLVESARTREECDAALPYDEIDLDVEGFLRGDADDDGVFSRAEIRVAVGGRITKPGDPPPQDPALSDEDVRKLSAFWADAGWDAALALHDADKDGKLAESELSGLLVAEPWKFPPDEGRRGNPFMLADKDGDGKLTKTEFADLALRLDTLEKDWLNCVDPLRENLRWRLRALADAKYAPKRKLTLKRDDTLFVRTLGKDGKAQHALLTLDRVSMFNYQCHESATNHDRSFMADEQTTGSYYGLAQWPANARTEMLKLKSGEYECLVYSKRAGRTVWVLKDWQCIEMKVEEDGKVVREVLEIEVK